MHQDWPEMAAQLTGAIKEVRLGGPEVTKAFSAMARAATEAGTIDAKTKELIALAISVAIQCDGCVAFHSQAAAKQGATREEIMEVMGMALYMGAGPSLMYAAQAVEAFDQFAAQAGEAPTSA
jgi:AhpD family alkylhydroperoxidase